MICKLVLQGKRVGITALSHNVIHLLLEEVIDAAQEEKIDGVRCMEKVNEVSDDDPAEGIIIVTNNEAPLGASRSGAANVVGGTSWLWTRPEYFDVLDALFIDEAGQMSLADVLAVSQAAKNLILIGDPQQLDRPLKGSHPDGAEKSALQHLLGQHKTDLQVKSACFSPRHGGCIQTFADLRRKCFTREGSVRARCYAIEFWTGTIHLVVQACGLCRLLSRG